MKTVLKCLFALVFIAIFSSCEKDEHDVKPSATGEFIFEVGHDGPGDKSKDDGDL